MVKAAQSTITPVKFFSVRNASNPSCPCPDWINIWLVITPPPELIIVHCVETDSSMTTIFSITTDAHVHIPRYVFFTKHRFSHQTISLSLNNLSFQLQAFIDRDVREQIDSTSLRKIIRNLALQQPSLPNSFNSRLGSVTQNDAFVHKQMLQEEGKVPIAKIPPQNVQPPRPNLPHGYRCPHCNIIFYGTTAIKLHMVRDSFGSH